MSCSNGCGCDDCSCGRPLRVVAGATGTTGATGATGATGQTGQTGTSLSPAMLQYAGEVGGGVTNVVLTNALVGNVGGTPVILSDDTFQGFPAGVNGTLLRLVAKVASVAGAGQTVAFQLRVANTNIETITITGDGVNVPAAIISELNVPFTIGDSIDVVITTSVGMNNVVYASLGYVGTV